MAAGAFAFGPYHLDVHAKQLRRDGELVALSVRHVDLLIALVANAGQIVSKEDLIRAGWADVAVTDNSLEQAISTLRRTLGAPDPRAHAYIETQARRGYRFVAPVSRAERRESDEALDALLAPHRAWIEGRSALETLETAQIRHARDVFVRVVAAAPSQASAHVGLANACAMQFEMTRADASPDRPALEQAVMHAREACRLDPGYGEAWATLGFVLERIGERQDALAALRRAVTLEPDNWRHHVRLSYGSWGEERLRAAARTLALLPAFPLAHWLAATVHVARQAFGDAEREIAAGLGALAQQPHGSRFSGVAVHWLSGLLHLRRGDDDAAAAAFQRELELEASGHLYARECCASASYALGAVHLAAGRSDPARAAFREALTRLPAHPFARIGLAHLEGGSVTDRGRADEEAGSRSGADVAMARAALLTLQGRQREAAALVEAALRVDRHGPAGWLLPLEPLLRVRDSADVWAPALAILRARAA